MAGYSYTLYLLNMVVIGVFLAIDNPGGFHYSFPAFFIISLVSANPVAFIVARFTERKYEAIAAWIKKRTEDIRLHFSIRAHA